MAIRLNTKFTRIILWSVMNYNTRVRRVNPDDKSRKMIFWYS